MGNGRYKIGYTQGVFDLFHIGHLNLINAAKKHCDYLIVGVNSDDLTQNYKGITPTIPENDRMEIVANLKAVNEAIVVHTLDKKEIYSQIKFDAIFVGDDWKDNPRWIETKNVMEKMGVDVIFLPYTKRVSSTALRNKMNKKD